MSFDASAKVKQGRKGGYLHYVFRCVDDKERRQAGKSQIKYRNKFLQRNWTGSNLAYYQNENGDFVELENMDQIKNAVDRRLSQVTKPLKKDAVVIRPLLLQLDPEYYKDESLTGDDWDRTFQPMLDWAVQEFGRENILGIGVHYDETSPHAHIVFTPVKDDYDASGNYIGSRLNQKEFFKGPSDLSRMHRELREYMTGQGYEIDMTIRKQYDDRAVEIGPGRWVIKRTTEKEFRAMVDREIALAQAESDNADYLAQNDQLMRQNQQIQAGMLQAKADIDKYNAEADRAVNRRDEAIVEADRAEKTAQNLKLNIQAYKDDLTKLEVAKKAAIVSADNVIQREAKRIVEVLNEHYNEQTKNIIDKQTGQHIQKSSDQYTKDGREVFLKESGFVLPDELPKNGSEFER